MYDHSNTVKHTPIHENIQLECNFECDVGEDCIFCVSDLCVKILLNIKLTTFRAIQC